MDPIEHRQVPVGGGIELHVAEAGPAGGPVVVLCHGFPELWYSWRHQIPALAEAGYRVLAPDMRGFGRSSAPREVEAYAVDALMRDVLGLLDDAGAERAAVVGHDWGANLAWQLALAHPGRVSAVAGLSVPALPRAPAPPLELMRQGFGEDFYIVWLQEPGVADAALARDVRRTIATTRQWTAEWAADTEDEPPRPPFLTQEDLDVYVSEFERTGFTGGLNWYRNLGRNWELTAPLAERTIDRPALFVTGSRDPVRKFMPAKAMEGLVTDLREKVVVDGAGHWVQQERPDDVNEALLGFLRDAGW